MKAERKQVVLAVMGFIFLAVLFGGITGSLNLPRYSALAKNGVSTQGVVTETRCSVHNTVSYKFQVQGRDFHGSTNQLDRDCSMVRVGERLEVTFLPTDPSVNAGGDFLGAYKNERESVLLAALGMPTFITAVAVFRARRRRFTAGA